MSIINFIKNNVNTINNEFEINKSEVFEFKLLYKKPNEVLNFLFKGSGTYGNVFQVTNNTNETSTIPKGKSLVLKIMKRQNLNELDRTKEINQVINSSKNKYIIDKYVMNIHNVDMDNNLIFLEYIAGTTLDEHIKKTNLSNNELNIFFIKTLLSIKVFHNILKYSHRDIKAANIIYVPETGIMKCIDYGFICKLKDKNCKNKYEGTGKYIHPDMNKKYSTRKYNNVNFPDSISQDFFSTIILIFKIYIIYKKKQTGGVNQEKIYKNNHIINNPFVSNFNNTQKNMRRNNNLSLDSILINLLNKYENSFRSNKKNTNKKHRFESKFTLLQDLMKINENDIDNDIIKELVKIIKTFWDFQMNTFCINKKKKYFN